MNIKTFTKAVALLATTGQKAAQMAHDLGYEAMVHAFGDGEAVVGTGDIRPLDMVYKAMIAGRQRAEGFRVWVQMFAPIVWNGEGEIKLIPKDNKRYKAPEVGHAQANPFWTLDEANERTVKDLSPMALKAMIDRYIKTVGEADANGDVFDKDGKLKAKVKGNIVLMKDYANKLSEVAVPVEQAA